MKAKRRSKKGLIVRELSGVHLGRYPFVAGIKHYSRRRSVKFSKTTIEEDARKLKQFAVLFEEWKTRGIITTTDPWHLEPEAIEGFYRYMRQRELQSSTRRTYVMILRRYLEMFGNDVLDEMVDEGDIDIPLAEVKEIKAISIDDLRKIFAAAEDMEGYPGIMMRGLMALAFGTGCRPKEMFNAELQDIDLDGGMYFVRHPKGEGSWGKKEWVNIIREDMMPRLERFLKEREAYLVAYDIRSKYVFPNTTTGEALTGKTIRAHKDRLVKLCGVQFAIKDLRPTLTTLLVDDDPAFIEATSKQLRHSKSDTTKKYYLQINTQKAVKKSLADRWKNNQI